MAVVGPRPLLKEYLPLYNAHQARRHEVRKTYSKCNKDIKDSNIENTYGFEKKQFNNLTYDIWKWIGKSADNARNVRERAEANYQMGT